MLHGPQDDLGLGRVPGDVEARLEPEPSPHGRKGGVAPAARLVPSGPQVARVRGLRRHADGVGDLSRLHLVVAEEPGMIGRPAASADVHPAGRRALERRFQMAPDPAVEPPAL